MKEEYLKKLEDKVTSFIENEVARDESADVLKVFLEVATGLKEHYEKQLASQSAETKRDTEASIRDLLYSLNGIELELKDSLNTSEKNTLSQIKELSQRLYAEIKRVEDSIEEPEDYSLEIGRLGDLIKDFEKKIPTIPEFKQLEGSEIVDRINDLEIRPELQIDAKHIKNLPRNNGGNFTAMTGIKDIIAGTNITIDKTNPQYPTINSSGSGGGHTIQDEGVSLTQRTNLNFVGAGVTVTDGGVGPDSTIVTINTGSGGGSLSRQAVSGTIDGSNKTFTIPTPVVGNSFIDLNGQFMADGGIDYTLSGTTITYVTAPPNNGGIDTHYLYSGGGTTSSWVNDYNPPQTVNGSTLIFTVPVPCTQVIVYADGMRVKGGGVTYTFDGISTVTFTAGNAPGSTVAIDYLPS